MKLATIVVDGLPHAAVLRDGALALIGTAGADVGVLLRDATTTEQYAAMAAVAKRLLPLEGTRFLAPVLAPGKAVCVGLNYADHTKESAYEQPRHPTLFLRAATSLGADGADVQRPAGDDSLDFEGEMVAVIGSGGRCIPKERALAHVFGYTVGNDISVREFQFRSPQWTLGKNVDGSGPWGPFLVTADELPPGAAGLAIATRLNGEVMQSANTRDMIFNVATIIATISEAMTLEPGDIIFTGTPAGVGLGRTPKRYMQPGELVEVEIERIGRLRNGITTA